MSNNRLRPIDDVRVEMDYNGKEIDAFQGSGYNTIQEAVRTAYEASKRTDLNIEDYVFRVTNLTTGTSARYRVNAGDNIKILPEEN